MEAQPVLVSSTIPRVWGPVILPIWMFTGLRNQSSFSAAKSDVVCSSTP